MRKSVRKLEIHRETLLPLVESPKVQGAGTNTCSYLYWCPSVSYCVICKIP